MKKKKKKTNQKITRREFIKKTSIATSSIALSSLFIKCNPPTNSNSNNSSRNSGNSNSSNSNNSSSSSSRNFNNNVYIVKNGDCFQNISKLFELLGGISNFISPTDVVVIKGNAQWPHQGYTHTGCIKAVIDEILKIPGYSGEIFICDNVQNYYNAGQSGFDATTSYRNHNWSSHNWNSLATEYQSNGYPVAVKRWINEPGIDGPQDGEGWIRYFFDLHGTPIYLSYPVFESPLTAGKMIDMKNEVWESGNYTGQKVKIIFMPTLNNHGNGGEDYAGVTSAVKSFIGATEILYGQNSTYNHNGTDYYNMHSATFTQGRADYCGELTAKYIKELYSPVLYITAAMWVGHQSRTGNATETKIVLACTNPATLDYIACRDVISPYASFLNPDLDNNTRKQILGCINGGVGTIDQSKFEIVSFSFS